MFARHAMLLRHIYLLSTILAGSEEVDSYSIPAWSDPTLTKLPLLLIRIDIHEPKSVGWIAIHRPRLARMRSRRSFGHAVPRRVIFHLVVLFNFWV